MCIMFAYMTSPAQDDTAVRYADRDDSVEIGTVGYEELNLLLQHLARKGYKPHMLDDCLVRSAPSMIMRSECELFGLSMPRFAFRCYPTADKSSYINVRRPQVLVRVAEPRWKYTNKTDATSSTIALVSGGYATPLYEGDRSWVSPDDIVLQSSVIADSMFVLSEKLSSQYEFTTCNLAAAYGESSSMKLVPFMKHIEMGGGMCAQAACFIVTCILERHTRTVCGIADITSYAHNEMLSNQDSSGDMFSMAIDGLQMESLISYFTHPDINLSARLQFPVPSAWGIDHENTTTYRTDSKKNTLSMVLQSYVKSGFPVILHLDQSKMDKVAGGDNGRRSIYEMNEIKVNISDHSETRNHAVVVVGASHESANRFVINDPATMPFLECSIDNLYECWPSGKDGKGEFRRVLPVVPGAVQLFLATTAKADYSGRNDSKENASPGLFSIVDALARNSRDSFSSDAKDALELVPQLETLDGEYRLLDLNEIAGMATEGVRDCLPFLPREAMPAFLSYAAAERRPSRSERWVWVHYHKGSDPDGCGCSLWVWDAELPSPIYGYDSIKAAKRYKNRKRPRLRAAVLSVLDRGEKFLPYLLGVLIPKRRSSGARFGGGWLQVYEKRKVRQADISLITSCASRSVLQSVEHSPAYEELAGRELYMFMQADINHLKREALGEDPVKSPETAVQCLSRILNDYDSRNAICEYICDRHDNKGLHITSVATYIPELVSDIPGLDPTWPADEEADDDVDACEGVRALCSIVRIVKAIKERQGGLLPSVIELVGGGLSGGIWYGHVRRDNESKVAFVADQRTQGIAIKRIFRRIKHVAEEAYGSPKLSIAVELEPGRLNALSGLGAIRKLSNMISTDPVVSSVVGFNLDISHWRMAGIRPCDVDVDILNRVVHCHISGHHMRGHFGDTWVGAYASDDELKEWLALVHEAYRRRRAISLPDPSGVVAIEYEASGSPELTIRSIVKVSRLVTECVRGEV